MNDALVLIGSGKLSHVLFHLSTSMILFSGDYPNQLSGTQGSVVCTSSGAVIAETIAGPEHIDAPGETDAWTDTFPRGWVTESVETGMITLWGSLGASAAADLPSRTCPSYPYFVSPDVQGVITEAGERQAICVAGAERSFHKVQSEHTLSRVVHAVWKDSDDALVWTKGRPWGLRVRIDAEQLGIETFFRSGVRGQPEPWTATIDARGQVWMAYRRADGRRGILVADPSEGRWRRYGRADLPEVEVLKVLDGRPLALSVDGGIRAVGRFKSALLVPPRSDGHLVTGFCGKRIAHQTQIYLSLTTRNDEWVPSTGDTYEVWSSRDAHVDSMRRLSDHTRSLSRMPVRP